MTVRVTDSWGNVFMDKVFGSRDIPLVINDTFTINSTNITSLDLDSVGTCILNKPNFCDGSLNSEAVSGSRISAVFTNDSTTVTLLKTETDVKFWRKSKKIDFIVGLVNNDKITKVAVETKRISSFGGKAAINNKIVNDILNNAFSKAIDAFSSVCTGDLWDFCVLSLLIDDALIIDLINDWINKTNNIPFRTIVITLVTGNSDLIF